MHMARCYPAACISSTDLLPAVAHGNWSSEIQLNNNAHRTGGGGKTQVKKFTYAGGLSIRPFPTQGREVSPLHVHYCSPKNPILPFREIQEELSDVKSSFPSSCFQPKYCFHWKTWGKKSVTETEISVICLQPLSVVPERLMPSQKSKQFHSRLRQEGTPKIFRKCRLKSHCTSGFGKWEVEPVTQGETLLSSPTAPPTVWT